MVHLCFIGRFEHFQEVHWTDLFTTRRELRMAEETPKKKGQLSAAVLAGSALVFSSFAVGIPSAMADEEPAVSVATAVPEDEDTAEDVHNEETSSAEENTEEGSEDSEESEESADETDNSESGEASEPAESGSDQSASEEPTSESTQDEVDPETQDAEVEVDPFIYFSESSGPAGTTFEVGGGGFSPDGDVEISVTEPDSGEIVASSSASANEFGSIDGLELTIPEGSAGGVYDVTAVDRETEISVTEVFNVTDASLTITPEELDENDFVDSGVTVTIEGLEAGQDIAITVGNAYSPIPDLSGEATADAEGTVEYTIQGADSVYVGTYYVTALRADNDAQVGSASFEVTSEKPQVSTHSPDANDNGEIPQGGVLHVTGHNATPNSTVTIDFGIEGLETAEVETGENGDFATENVIPEDAESGVKTVTVTDGETGESGTAEYTVADAGDETPEGPQIELDSNEVYQGGSLDADIWNLTADGEVEVSWNPTETFTADENGELSAELPIADDADTGVQTLTVTDLTTEETASVEYTVLSSDDQVVDPALTIDPERIDLDDFVGDPEDGAGSNHIVEGMEPGTEISYVVSGPEYVNDYESTADVDEDGVASFVIHGYDVADPAVYLGEYNTVVTYVDDAGETQTLSGSFTVVDGDDDDSTAGGSDGDDDDRAPSAPVDVNGASGLAQTGANGVQLGFLAGGLLVVGAALLAFANRRRLFGRSA